jgi:hypothetical protein
VVNQQAGSADVAVASYNSRPNSTIELAYNRGRPLRNLLTNTRVLSFLAALCVAIGIVFSILLRDFSSLSRAGAVVVGLGIVTLSRTFLLKKDFLVTVRSGEHDNLNLNGPDHYIARGEPVPPRVKEDLRSRRAVGDVGPAMSFIGTLLWGFADLLNLLFPGFGAA